MSLLLSSMIYMLSLSISPHFTNTPDSLKKQEYDYYMQKSKRQRTAGTIAMIAGIVGGGFVLGSALLSTLGDAFVSLISLGTYQPEKRSYTVPLLLVGATLAVGIILLSAASNNKKIATKLSANVGIGSTFQLQQQTAKPYSYPQLSLKFSF